MDSVQSVLERAASLVTPNDKELAKLEAIEREILSKLRLSFERASVKPEIVTGGSFAKGTWLPGSADIDFFLLYPVDYPREKLETEAIESAKAAVKGFRINMRFAEHPYVEAIVEGARVNLVPCYKVERGKWQSAADRSPFHTEYMKEHLDARLRLETRLLKKFVKGAGVYGAELKVQGFSGYVCEVIALRFGSFESAVSHLAAVKPGDVVAIEPYDRNIPSIFTSTLIILDPIDATRNLGTAISIRSVARLALQSRRFLSAPDLRFFEGRIPKRRGSVKKEILERTVVVSFRTKPRSVDVLWGQLNKSLHALANKIESWDYTLLRTTAASNEKDESAFVFLLLETTVSGYKTREGPSVFRSEDYARYAKKNRNKAVLSWLDSEGRVRSLFRRDRGSDDITKLLPRVLRSSQSVANLGLSKEVMREIKNFRIERGTSVIRSQRKDRDWLNRAVTTIAIGEEDEL